MAPSPAEPQVRFFSPMPTGYQFVPKGDVYITTNVRKRTHETGATLYVVIDKHRKPIGLRCPISVYEGVAAAAEESAARRVAAVRSRDTAVEREFASEVRRLYPNAPRVDVAKILQQALEKRSRRVGRTGTLDLDSKVHLAVNAYIRHCHTSYEKILKDGKSREVARLMVADRMREVARSWMGERRGATTNLPKDRASQRKGKKKSHAARKTTSATGRRLLNRTRRDSGAADGGNPEESDAEQSESDDVSIFEDNGDDSDWEP